MRPANGKIYFAGPLFGMADKLFNKQLAKILCSEYGYEVLLPQDFDVNENMDEVRDPVKIAKTDIEALESSDVILVNCDGADVDSGTAFELGWAVRDHKITVAWRTDSREFAKGERFNAMLYLASQVVICCQKSSHIQQLAFLIHEAIGKERINRGIYHVK